jgi:hypothetical protein
MHLLYIRLNSRYKTPPLIINPVPCKEAASIINLLNCCVDVYFVLSFFHKITDFLNIESCLFFLFVNM